MSEQEATADFERKNAHYMAIYETVQESEDFSFLKVRQSASRQSLFRAGVMRFFFVFVFFLNLHRRPRRIPTTLYTAGGRQPQD